MENLIARRHHSTISSVYNMLPDLVMCKDINGRYTNCNPSYEAFAGCKEQELIGKTTGEIKGLSERISVDIIETDKQVLEERITTKSKQWLVYPDGSRRFFESIKTPLIQDNEVTGLIAVIRDITELQNAMDNIQKAQERARLMLDSIPLCCFIANKKSELIDCNNEAVKLFELKDKQEFLGRFGDLSPEYQPDGSFSATSAFQMIDKALLEGRITFEWMHQLLDGTPLPSYVSCVRINYSDENMLMVYIRDMREYEQMHGEIEKKNNLLRTINNVSAILLDPDLDKFESNIFYSMGMIAKAVDVDRVYLWKNHIIDGRRHCTQLCEWSDKAEPQQNNEFTTDIPYDNFPGLDETLSKGNFLNNIVRKLSPEMQSHLVPQGIVSILMIPVFSQDQFWGFIGFDDCRNERFFSVNEEMILRSAGRMIAAAFVRNDMTQSIKSTTAQLEIMVKEAREASRTKSDFLAKMSHEIRTPMNAIIGMAELAMREQEIKTARNHVFTIKQAGANLLAIINDILDFSKIESGKLEIASDYYQFSSLLNDVISIIRMRAIDSHLRFVVNIDSGIPNELYGDETRVRQILINTLSNAVKYTDEGFVSFIIMGSVVNDDTIILTIDIMDSGRGIKQNDIDKLFGDFVQLDAVKNKNVEGTGLGLAITRSLIHMMDGDIQVNSEYGKGSTFTITLPQKFRTLDRLATVEKPEDKNVIVFERRDIYANSLILTIDNLGVKCEVASTADEFRAKMASKSYSYVFIASALYEKHKSLFAECNVKSRIVLLTEFGDPAPGSGWSVLAMPVHSISIANVLNGVSEVYSYKEDSESHVSFVASDAKVLVVDDIRTNLTVTEGLLLPYQMHIDLCKNGLEAIAAVKSGDYDLVFMDHWMPEMDGIEAVRHIRALGEKDEYFKNLPILALTANAISGTQEIFMNSGFNGYLTKPIDTIQLNTALEKWIPKKKRKIPASNVKNTDVKNRGEKPGTAFSIGNFKIDGLDTDSGVRQTGGSVERYLNTLDVFFQDGLEKIKEVKTCLQKGDVSLYSIYVHALKSASASIGAARLSDAAQSLETAGKKADMDFLNANTPGFLDDLEKMLNGISALLSAWKAEKTGGLSASGEAAIPGLLRLQLAIETLDITAINNALETLSERDHTDNIRAAVNEISARTLAADYNAALEQISKVLTNLK